jgi:hypothetical protein
MVTKNTLWETAKGELQSDKFDTLGTKSGGTIGFSGNTPIPPPAAQTPVTLTPPTRVTVTSAYGFQTGAQFNALLSTVNAIVSLLTTRGDWK